MYCTNERTYNICIFCESRFPGKLPVQNVPGVGRARGYTDGYSYLGMAAAHTGCVKRGPELPLFTLLLDIISTSQQSTRPSRGTTGAVSHGGKTFEKTRERRVILLLRNLAHPTPHSVQLSLCSGHTLCFIGQPKSSWHPEDVQVRHCHWLETSLHVSPNIGIVHPILVLPASV